MMNKLSVGFVLPEFITEKNAGGIATYYDNISRLLADNGNKVVVFVLSEKNESIEYYHNVIVNRIHVETNNIDQYIPSSFIRLWSKKVNELVREYIDQGNRIDILQYANYMGMGFERLDDVPTIVRISSFQPYWRAAFRWVFDASKNYDCETAADYIELLSVIKADAVYGPSVLLANIFEKKIGKRVFVIESPYYPRDFYCSTQRDALIDRKKYILSFSSLNLLKGAKVIGDSICKVLESNPDVCWHFAGAEMPWEDENGETVSPSKYILDKAGNNADRVVFLGKVEHEALMDIVLNSEVCVMPSRIDNLPNTCIEAMAMGKLVVGTRGASYDQLIVNGESGFLVNIDNRDELVSTINRALRLGDDQKKRIGEKAKDRIEQMRPDTIVNKILDLYESTIASFWDGSLYKESKYYEQTKIGYNSLIKKCNRPDADKYLIS